MVSNTTPGPFIAENSDADFTDSKPGDYFVSAIDGNRFFLMAGPYENHADAKAAVTEAKLISDKHDPRAWFLAWGTCRLDVGSGKVGVLNRHSLI